MLWFHATRPLLALLTAAGAPQAEPVPEPPAPLEPIPSERQLAWAEHEYYGFVHFGINTFTDREWGTGLESPQLFAPTELDCRQWVRIAKQAGMAGLILTAKHHDGFCLWPSELTEHTLAASPWKDGAGDLVSEFIAACVEGELDWGIYVSPWDLNAESYGDSPSYDEFFRGQLRETLAGRSPAFEVWFDGANGEGPNGKQQVYDWASYVELVRELQPGAVIFNTDRPDVRWIGNEDGVAGETNWSLYRAAEHRASANNQADLTRGHEDGTHWIPGECDVSIRPGWFYHASEDELVKSPDELMQLYLASVGRNATLLLNVPPDTRGRFHENDIESLLGLRALLDATFGTNLARGVGVDASNVRGEHPAYRGKNVVDGDPLTYWATDDGVLTAALEIDLGIPVLFNRIVIEEYVALGQRVRGFIIEAFSDGDWQKIATGTTVGHKRILAIEPVSARRLRVRFSDARGPLAISSFALHLTPPRVIIDPPGGGFLGSTRVQLGSDLPGTTIHYTLDGSEPTRSSPRYAAPLEIERDTQLSARAFHEGWQTVQPNTVSFRAWDSAQLHRAVEFEGRPEAGLRWTAFEGNWTSLAEVSWSLAKARGFTPSFELDGRTRAEHIALRFEGYLSVPEDGVYRLALSSDDGSQLWLCDSLVVDNDGLHGMQERSGEIALAAGWHPLRVDYFNSSGSLGLSVSWSGPGVRSGPIPVDALGH